MTSMTIKTFLATASKLPTRTSVMIRGNHGVGKSQVIRQLSALFGFAPETVIDRRMGQMTEGDLLGLPSVDDGVTRFNPPEWVKAACVSPKVLFLDELNRATQEVMQACFQLVLDRELCGWKLHPETRVYSAINADAQYTVNEVDPALLDRFWVVDLEPTAAEWIEWGRADNSNKPHGKNVFYTVVDYVQSHEKMLDPPKNCPAKDVSPTRRSWERLGDALVEAGVSETPADPLFYQMALGFVGTEAAIGLTEFAKNDASRVTGEEILNDWNKAKEKVNRLGQERLNVAIDKVAEYAHTLEKLSAKQQKNLTAFTDCLPGELVVHLWQRMVEKGADKIELAKTVHAAMVKQILAVFKVDPEKGGEPVIPPGLLEKQEQAKQKK